MSETLLPGTEAIAKGEAEWKDHGRKLFVRYRTLSTGSVYRELFTDKVRGFAFFLECVEKLRYEAAALLKGQW